MHGPRDPSALTLAALYGSMPAAVHEAIVKTAKALAASVPAPRHDPTYGLDRTLGLGLPLLERLSGHGDFRKYVSVLDAGAGLGGVARWMARRYGCRVLTLDRFASQVALSARLSARAGLAGRVRGAAGSVTAIPAADGVFTQVWSVEVLHHVADRATAFAELFRVLRPGCTLALQEIVRRDETVPIIGGAWRHGTPAEYREGLARAGFRDLACEDVTAERVERSSIVLSAHERLAGALAVVLPPDHVWHRARAACAAVEAITHGPDYRVLHLFGRRPSV